MLLASGWCGSELDGVARRTTEGRSGRKGRVGRLVVGRSRDVEFSANAKRGGRARCDGLKRGEERLKVVEHLLLRETEVEIEQEKQLTFHEVDLVVARKRQLEPERRDSERHGEERTSARGKQWA